MKRKIKHLYMRKILFIIILIIYSIPLFSQEDSSSIFTVKGKIVSSETKEPLEYATVIFKNSTIDSLAYGSVTNAKGFFTLDIRQGNYNAFAEFYSFKTKQLSISSINKNLNLGNIELEVDTEVLDEIEIVAEKKAIEYKANKLIANIAKDISSSGSTAIDVLNNVPSVTLDLDGNIKLRGQSNVTVMINGRVSSFSKTEALKNLPANSIQKIEVITNPGASYNASYSSIINIILKKGKDEGFNASITGTIGENDIYGGLVNLSYKTKSVNVYTNTSLYHNNPVREANYNNTYFVNGNIDSYLNESSIYDSNEEGFYSNNGIDFYLSEFSTLSTTINYTNLDYKSKTLTNTDFLNNSQQNTASNQRIYNRDFDDEIVEYTVEYKQLFKKEGKSFTSFFSHYKDVELFDKNVLNSNISFNNSEVDENNKLNHTEVEVKYANTIKDASSYLIGFNGNYGKTDFRYGASLNSKHIDYKDDTNAFFAEFEHQAEKLYVGVGLRSEFATINMDYLNTNTSVSKKYSDLFPSSYLEYTINDLKTVALSYSSGIYKPGYYELQPFEEKVSETSSFKGNEQITPMYYHFVDLTYAYFGNVISFIPKISYNRYNNYWQNVTFETGEKINGASKILTSPFNLDHVNYVGIDVTTLISASSNLDFTANINLYNFETVGTIEIEDINNNTILFNHDYNSFNGNFSLLAQLKIPKVFNIQTNINHTLKSKQAFSTRKAFSYASLAISKDMFQKNGTLSFTINDIFNSNEENRNRFDTNYFSKSIVKNKYRTIKLSFTYRFNQSKAERKINFDKKDTKPKY